LHIEKKNEEILQKMSTKKD